MKDDRLQFTFLGPDLSRQVFEDGKVSEIASGTKLLEVGDYVKVIPFVLEGVVRVFTRHEDKELLLYYIEPRETCTMSFAATLKNEPSKIAAQVEADARILLIPSTLVLTWATEYPSMNNFIFEQFNKRYSELLDSINHLLVGRLDLRLLEYLKDKQRVVGADAQRLTHRQIATELGTAREVVTRLLHRLENEGKVAQSAEGIQIL